MPRLTRLYTRKGDDGTTGLGGGQRVPKDSPRVTAYGAVDELNSAIGIALSHGLVPRLAEILPVVQNELFHLGSDLCFLEEDKQKFKLPQIEARHVTALERIIDELNEAVGPLENFILPGGAVRLRPPAARPHDLPARGTRRHRALAPRTDRPVRRRLSESAVGRAVRDGPLREQDARRRRAAVEHEIIGAL